MSTLLRVGEFSGAPDGSLAGYERRLAATRAAIRYRNGTKRHFCHLNEYRSAYLRSVLELRKVTQLLRKEYTDHDWLSFYVHEVTA